MPSKSVWAVQYRQWYPAFNKEIENSLTALLNGEVTPEGFCDRVEAAADKTRKYGVKQKRILPTSRLKSRSGSQTRNIR